MIQIDQILVTYDPLLPKRKPFDLTLEEVIEFGESFFDPGFTAQVFLTNGEHWSCVKTKEGWSACLLNDSELEDDDFYDNEDEDFNYAEKEEIDKDENYQDKRVNIDNLNVSALENKSDKEPDIFEKLLNDLLDYANKQPPSIN